MMVSKSAKNSVRLWPVLLANISSIIPKNVEAKHLHPANDDEKRHDECSNLDGRANTDANSELRLVLHGHPHGSNVLRSVADDRQKDETNECLGDAVAGRSLFDGRNQDIGTQRSDDGHSEEANMIQQKSAI
jgi:hypothetical protein